MLIHTSGWFCIFDKGDRRRHTARRIYSASTRRVTHSYVISELFGLGISRRHDLAALGSFVQDILRDSDVHTIWVDETLTWRALELLNSRKDKSWSLCDAVSFVIMGDLNLTDALTTDRHFEQAGFIRLLDS